MIPTCLKYEALGAFLFATSAQLCSASAQESASAYPSKPITMVVPFAPGGGTDMLARMIARRLESAWSKSVVIEKNLARAASFAQWR